MTQNGNGSSTPGPLDGIRVLDLGTVYAAPIAAMLLGDYGAEVIKVEHPRGDPARTHGHSKDGHGLWWKVISRNKRAVTLNLGRPEGRALIEDLVGESDVLIELPPRRDGEVGHRAGPPARAQPRARDPAGDGLRPVRPLRAAAGVRGPWPKP